MAKQILEIINAKLRKECETGENAKDANDEKFRKLGIEARKTVMRFERREMVKNLAKNYIRICE